MIRLVVADDHAIVRAGVRAVLEDEQDLLIVAEAGDGEAAIEAVRKHTPDVLLIDLGMPGCNGVEAIARIRQSGVRTRVLVLSMHGSADQVRTALRAGAHGYVVKGSGLDHLLPAIRAVAAEGEFLDDTARAALSGSASLLPETSALQQLTPRERQILRLIAEGRSSRDISSELQISLKTVDTHRTSLMKKLDLHNAQSVTLFALRHGVI